MTLFPSAESDAQASTARASRGGSVLSNRPPWCARKSANTWPIAVRSAEKGFTWIRPSLTGWNMAAEAMPSDSASSQNIWSWAAAKTASIGPMCHWVS